MNVNTIPLAIQAAKEVEDLVAKGMDFDKAVRLVRPKYASAVRRLRRCCRQHKIGGTK